MSAIDLTVLVVTYNHAPFIEMAIASVLRQRTSFDFEVIVSEDYSTDGTREIVRKLAETHPDRIRLLLSERNRNDNSVLRRGLEAARGRYVAMLDGDDFWTSNEKLQRQVDFLDSHPECSCCFHNVNVLYEEGGVKSHLFHQESQLKAHTQTKPKERSTLADILRYNLVPTCSAVFRAEISRKLPDWYDGLAAGDWPLHVLSAERGELAYLDQVMGTYRIHAGGMWSMNQSRLLQLSDVEEQVRSYDTFNRYLDFSFDRQINEEVSALYQTGATHAYKRGDYPTASTCARRSLRRAAPTALPSRWKAMAVLALSPASRLLPRRR